MKKLKWIPALLLLLALSMLLLTGCDDDEDPPEEGCEHAWVLDSIKNAGNCQTEETGLFTCTKCEETKTDTTGKKGGHVIEVIPSKAATCTATGLTEGKKCSLCGTVTVPQTEIAKKAHTPVTDKGYDSTCSKTGLTDGSHCGVCSAPITAQTEIPKKAHTPVDDIGYDSTCSATGLTNGSHCGVCSAPIVAQTEIPKKAHTPVDDIGYDSTCSATGLTNGSHCGVCSAPIVAQTEIPKKAHTPVDDIGYDSTCSATGLTDGSHCGVCSAPIVAQTEIPKKPHTPVEDKGYDSTCTATGLTDGSHCGVCSAPIVAQTEIPKKAHTPVEDKGYDSTCTATGLTDGSHCGVCSAPITAQTEIAKKPHTPVVDKGYAATCTKDGLTDGSHCGVCSTPITAQTVIPAEGHSKTTEAGTAATCLTAGKTASSYCPGCGMIYTSATVIPALGHNFVDGSCERCHITLTEGLLLTPAEDGESYTVTGLGDFTGTKLVIPATYNGKPVLAIAAGAFANNETIESITLTGSIRSIGDGAFENCTALKEVFLTREVVSVGSNAFGGCTALSAVTCADLSQAAAWDLNWRGGSDIKLTSSAKNGKTPYEIYLYAQTQIQKNPTKYSLTRKDILDYYANNELLETEMINDYDFQVVGNDVYYYDRLTGDSLYYIGGYMYQDGVKIKVSNEMFRSLASSFGNNAPVFTAEYFVNVEFYQKADGNYCLRLTMSPEHMTGLLESILGAQMQGFSLSECIYTYTFDANGYLISQHTDATLSTPAAGMHAVLDSDITLSGVGTLSSVQRPANMGSAYEYNPPACTTHKNIVTVPGYAATCTAPGATEGQYCTDCLNTIKASTVIPAAHSYENGICTVCGYINGVSNGLSYALSEDETHYIVIGIGSFDGTSLVLPKTLYGLPVAEIGEGAFAGCTQLRSITLHSGITKVGNSAFENCTALQSVSTESKVLIGDRAFAGCTSLQSVTLIGTTHLGAYAFAGCVTLRGISMNDVTHIGAYAFANCTGLTTFVLHNGIQSIGLGALAGCENLTELTLPFVGGSATENTFIGYIFGAESAASNADALPEKLEKITVTGNAALGENAFAGITSLTHLILSADIPSAAANALSGCTGLTEVTLPAHLALILPDTVKTVILNGGTAIPQNAFKNFKALHRITICAGIRSIGSGAFEGCDNLFEVYNLSTLSIVAGSNDFGGVFRDVVMVFRSLSESGEVVTVGDFVFYVTDDSHLLIGYNGSETSLTLPEYYVENYNSYSYTVHRRAFRGADFIESITFSPNIRDIDEGAFDSLVNVKHATGRISQILTLPKSELLTVTVTEYADVPANAFAGCEKLTSFVLQNGGYAVGESAFAGCTSLTEVKLGTVLSVNASAFAGCTALSKVEASGLDFIGERAFAGCVSILDIDLSCVLTISDEAFLGCTGLTKLNLPRANNVASTAFAGCTSVTSATVQGCAIAALAGCEKLETLTVCDGTIAADAFETLTGIKTLEIQLPVDMVARGALKPLTNLKTLEIAYLGETAGDTEGAYLGFLFGATDAKTHGAAVPASLTSVSVTGASGIIKHAFLNCANLTYIYINESAWTIGEEAFLGCTALEKISLPFVGEKRDTPSYGFAYVFGTIPASLKTVILTNCTAIPASAFKDAATIYEVILPEKLQSIGEKAFYGCYHLKTITIPASVSSIGSQAFYYCYTLAEVINLSSASFASNTYLTTYALVSSTSGTSQIENKNGFLFLTKGTATYLIGYVGNATELVLPTAENSYTVRQYAFYGSDITTLHISGGVKSIEQYAFAECKSLLSYTADEGITSLGNYAFANCPALASVYFPKTLKYSASSSTVFTVFSGSNNITSITVAEGHESLYTANNCLIYVRGLSTPRYSILFFAGKGATVPTNLSGISIKEITKEAFKGHTDLTVLVLPEGLETIGESAFEGCTSLRSVVFPSTLRNTGRRSFKGCTALSSVTLNETLTTIEEGLFNNCIGLKTITIPAAVTSIETQAFFGCTNLLEVVNKSELTIQKGAANTNGHIGYYALEVHNGDSKIDNVDGFLFYPMESGVYLVGYVGTDSTITLPESYKGESYALYKGAFAGVQADAVILQGVTEIGADAFAGAMVKTVIFTESVKTIGDYAFRNCTGLTSLVIPSTVTSIGRGILNGCTSLAELTVPFLGKTADEGSTLGHLFGTTTNAANTNVPASLERLTVTADTLKDSALYNCQYLKEVYLPNATTIGKDAFKSCKALTKVSIPKLTTLGANAFYMCEALTTVDLTGATSIGDYAFYGCKALKELVIPDTVTSIGSYILYNCTSLESLTVPFIGASATDNKIFGYFFGISSYGDHRDRMPAALKHVVVTKATDLVNQAFANCTLLESITLPSAMNSIGGMAFYNCAALKNLTLPTTLNTLGANAFSYCTSLTEIKLPEGLTSLPQTPFEGSKIESIILPESLTRIESGAFKGCQLKSITLPKSLTYIGNGAFENCTALETVVLNSTNLADLSSTAYIFLGAGQAGKGITLIVGKDVTAIPANFFNGYKNNSTTGVPKLVSVIFEEGSACTAIGERAFYYCTGLTEIALPEGLTTIGQYAFAGTGLKEITLPEALTALGNYAFYYSSVEKISFAENSKLESIGSMAFAYSAIKELSLPDSVTAIGSSAFYGCASLQRIVLGENLTSIGNQAFRDCTAVEEIYYAAKSLADLSSSANAFFNVGKTSGSVTITIAAGVQRIPAYLFYSSNAASNGNYVTAIVFEEGSACTEIGDSAFEKFNALLSVNLPEGLKKIGNSAFSEARGLKTLTLPETLEYIGSGAFNSCTSLTKIVVPDSVTYIGSGAFGYCTALKEITIPFIGDQRKTASDANQYPFGYIFGTSISRTDPEQEYYGADMVITTTRYGVPSTLKKVTVTGGDVLYGAFMNCSSITTIILPSTATMIGGKAFSGCSALTSLTIPEGVKSLGDEAFHYVQFTSITIPASVTAMGEDMFYGCTRLTSIYFRDAQNWFYYRSSSPEDLTAYNASGASSNASFFRTGNGRYRLWIKVAPAEA